MFMWCNIVSFVVIVSAAASAITGVDIAATVSGATAAQEEEDEF